MFGSTNEEIIATLILLFIHILQGLYLKVQLHKTEAEYGEIQVHPGDKTAAFRLKFLREPYLMAAGYAMLTVGTLLVCMVSGPVAVGFSAYAVVSWRPLSFDDEEE